MSGRHGIAWSSLVGTILPVGRVAGDRPELFVGGGVQTPADGIALLPEHRSSTVVMRFDPIRGDGRLAASGPSPAELACRAGHGRVRAEREDAWPQCRVSRARRSDGCKASARCVKRSLVTAVATVPAGAYAQATAEVRAKGNHRRVLTWL